MNDHDDYDDYESSASLQADEREFQIAQVKKSLIASFGELIDAINWAGNELGVSLSALSDRIACMADEMVECEIDEAVANAAEAEAEASEFRDLAYGPPP